MTLILMFHRAQKGKIREIIEPTHILLIQSESNREGGLHSNEPMQEQREMIMQHKLLLK